MFLLLCVCELFMENDGNEEKTYLFFFNFFFIYLPASSHKKYRFQSSACIFFPNASLTLLILMHTGSWKWILFLLSHCWVECKIHHKMQWLAFDFQKSEGKSIFLLPSISLLMLSTFSHPSSNSSLHPWRCISDCEAAETVRGSRRWTDRYRTSTAWSLFSDSQSHLISPPSLVLYLQSIRMVWKLTLYFHHPPPFPTSDEKLFSRLTHSYSSHSEWQGKQAKRTGEIRV